MALAAALLVVFGAALVALLAQAQETSAESATADAIRAHGVSTFGELEYGPDFAHFDYVNPDAPKDGRFTTWAFGTFDSLTPYILKGNAAESATLFYDTLLTGDFDEPDAMYGLLAHTVEYPESRELAIFHLRPEARFRDGTPVTADERAASPSCPAPTTRIVILPRAASNHRWAPGPTV